MSPREAEGRKKEPICPIRGRMAGKGSVGAGVKDCCTISDAFLQQGEDCEPGHRSRWLVLGVELMIRRDLHVLHGERG